MRLGPVPIRFAHLYPDRLEELIQLAVESSLPTHASPQCLSACAYLATVLAALVQGCARDIVLSPQWEMLERLRACRPLHPEVEEVVQGSYRCKPASAIVGSGYVVSSLEAAVWAFADAANFRQAVLRAVNLGDDSDTVGAVCGQLAGACWGESGIPPEWREELARRDLIDQALAGLLG